MKNNWTKSFENRCYVEVPNHGVVDLEPFVWGAFFYKPIFDEEEPLRVILDLDVPRKDTTSWQSDDPDMMAVYDTLHSSISNRVSVCKFKPPKKRESMASLRKIGMGDSPYKGRHQIRLVRLEWWLV